MALHVIDPGLYTLVVDRGRPSCRALGVPVGGAADRRSLALANALVGNAPDRAGLEISLAGPRLRADCSTACVVYGAPFVLKSENRSDLAIGKTFTLAPDEVFTIGGTPAGMRAYLCVSGGLASSLVLGSQSSLRPVRAGDRLDCRDSTIAGRFVPLPPREDQGVQSLRVVPGAQADWIGPLDGEYEVTPASNRMGLRLRGPALPFRGGVAGEMVSEPVVPGTIQVTRDGQCIILGIDGQTIGGYPKVAHVIAADLDVLGQLRPGRRLRFVPVTLAEAASLYRQRETELAEWLTRLQTLAV